MQGKTDKFRDTAPLTHRGPPAAAGVTIHQHVLNRQSRFVQLERCRLRQAVIVTEDSLS
jgi:hypothetical protein